MSKPYGLPPLRLKHIYTSSHGQQSERQGAGINTNNRFRNQEIEYTEEDWQQWEEPETNVKTLFIEEISKSILSTSDSPDLRNFNSINPYRVCEHGCIYCYARNSHEYWGFSAGLDFETKIVVKKMLRSCLKNFLILKNGNRRRYSFQGILTVISLPKKNMS